VFSLVPSGIAFAAVAFGFGLLTRSMGGGITLALGLAFILDGVIGFIPGVDGFGFGQLTHDLTFGLAGNNDVENNLAVAIVGTIAWVVVIVVPAWAAVPRGDLK
jgi:ABC-2 type transport system permease protein